MAMPYNQNLKVSKILPQSVQSDYLTAEKLFLYSKVKSMSKAISHRKYSWVKSIVTTSVATILK